MITKLYIILSCLSFISCEDVPNPNKDPLKCGDYRDITIGSICDPDKYLKYEEIKEYTVIL